MDTAIDPDHRKHDGIPSNSPLYDKARKMSKGCRVLIHSPAPDRETIVENTVTAHRKMTINVVIIAVYSDGKRID
jgi:hypothetical protein